MTTSHFKTEVEQLPKRQVCQPSENQGPQKPSSKFLNAFCRRCAAFKRSFENWTRNIRIRT